MFQSTGSRQSAEKEAHSLTHVPFRSCGTVSQRAKGQQYYHKSKQKASSGTQLDHSFYEVRGEAETLKVLTFVETSTSMSGAGIVPDLPAHQVAIKALKKLIAVNGFTKSVLQCDGHSGIQEQVGRDMSLPLKSVLHKVIRVRVPWRDFTKLSMAKSEPSELDLQIISDFIRIV